MTMPLGDPQHLLQKRVSEPAVEMALWILAEDRPHPSLTHRDRKRRTSV